MKLSYLFCIVASLNLFSSNAQNYAVIGGQTSDCDLDTGSCQSSNCKAFGLTNAAQTNCNKNTCPDSICNFTVASCETSGKKCWGYTVCEVDGDDCVGLGAPCIQDGNSGNFKTCANTNVCGDFDQYVSSTGICDLNIFDAEELKGLVAIVKGDDTCEVTEGPSFTISIKFLLIIGGAQYSFTFSLGYGCIITSWGTTLNLIVVIQELDITSAALAVYGFTISLESTETIRLCMNIDRLTEAGEFYNNLTLTMQWSSISFTVYHIWIFDLKNLFGVLLAGAEGSWKQIGLTVEINLEHTSVVTATSTNATTTTDDSNEGLLGLLALLVIPFLLCLCCLWWLYYTRQQAPVVYSEPAQNYNYAPQQQQYGYGVPNSPNPGYGYA